MKRIKTERCPECAKKGKDKHGDNLATYPDGHKWCFSCGYYVPATGLGRIFKHSQVDEPESTNQIFLPFDSDYVYPTRALHWVEQYGLDKNDLLTNRVVWSDYYQRLIFPIFDDTGLLAYQGRYFGQDHDAEKWYGRGDLKNIFHIFHGVEDGSVILTEDIISAIKLRKVGHSSMPLFGSHISYQRLVRLKKLFKRVIIWLDPDKKREALEFSMLATTVGLDCKIVFSEYDPKDHSPEEIEELLV